MVSMLGVGLAFLAAFCLMVQALSVRMGTRDTDTVHGLVVILALNTIIILPLAIILPESHAVTPTAFVAFVAAGIVGTMIGRLLFYGGIKRIGAARAEPLKATMPLYATILAVLLLSESVSGLQFFGVVCIVIGVAVITWDEVGAFGSIRGTPDWVGMSLPMIGAFFFALEPIFATVGLQEGTPVLVGLAIKSVTATTIFSLYLLLRGQFPTRATVNGDFRWLVLAGVATSAFLLTYYAGLEVSRVSVVVPIMHMSPLLVALASVLFFRRIERVTALLVIGSAIIITGSILVALFG